MSTITKPRTLRLAATIASLLLVAALIVRTTEAAFTATTDNSGNEWATGTVVLTDDDGGTSAMFTLADPQLKPGTTLSKCITVSYAGSLDPTGVKLDVPTLNAGTLGAFLTVTVEEGTLADPAVAAFPSCTGFTADAAGQIYNDKLSAMTGSYGAWDPSGAASKTYRFTVSVDDTNAAQGTSAGATTFRWTTGS